MKDLNTEDYNKVKSISENGLWLFKIKKSLIISEAIKTIKHVIELGEYDYIRPFVDCFQNSYQFNNFLWAVRDIDKKDRTSVCLAANGLILENMNEFYMSDILEVLIKAKIKDNRFARLLLDNAIVTKESGAARIVTYITIFSSFNIDKRDYIYTHFKVETEDSPACNREHRWLKFVTFCEGC